MTLFDWREDDDKCCDDEAVSIGLRVIWIVLGVVGSSKSEEGGGGDGPSSWELFGVLVLVLASADGDGDCDLWASIDTLLFMIQYCFNLLYILILLFE